VKGFMARVPRRPRRPGEIAGQVARHARRDLVQHDHRRADLAGRAVAALKRVVRDEGRLHRVEVVGPAEPLDRRDRVALVHGGETQAGVNAHAVHQHRAGAAMAVVAALLGAGEMQVLAQSVEQRDARVEFDPSRLPVHREGDCHRVRLLRARGLGRAPGRRACGGRAGSRSGVRPVPASVACVWNAHWVVSGAVGGRATALRSGYGIGRWRTRIFMA
jgi:hypothetical protein